MGSVSEKEVQSVIRDVDVLKNHMERVSFTNVCMFVTLSQLTPSQSLLQNTPDTMSRIGDATSRKKGHVIIRPSAQRF